MGKVTINKRGIKKLTDEIQRELNKNPVSVPIRLDNPALPAVTSAGGHVFNGPVFFGDMNGAQIAWSNNGQVNQGSTQVVAPGYEALAQAVSTLLRVLPDIEMSEPDREDAEVAAREMLTEAVAAEPDQAKVRRSSRLLHATLASIGATAAGVLNDQVRQAFEAALDVVKQFIS